MDYSLFREQERAGWGARAEGYRSATARATTQSIPRLLDMARVFHGARVLDVGCGPGYAAGAAACLGAEVEGLDFSSEMITQARLNFPAVSFQTGDAEELPHPDASFDAVTSNIVLFHVTDPQRAMAQAFRVLRPGGAFAFSQWHGPAQSPVYALLLGILKEHADMTKADPAPDAYALSNPDGVAAMMATCGFDSFERATVRNILRVPEPSFFEFFMRFGVRVPLIVCKQTTEIQSKIKAAIDERMQAFWVDDHYQIEMPSLIFAGRRP